MDCKWTVSVSKLLKTWRRDRDSNPGYPFEYTRFPSVRLQPLGHLSVGKASCRSARFVVSARVLRACQATLTQRNSIVTYWRTALNEGRRFTSRRHAFLCYFSSFSC